MENKSIVIYTDGSCHTQLKIGGWVALIFSGNKEILLDGKEFNTSHNRMELLSVIKSLEYIVENSLISSSMKVISDSQYVVGILERKEKLKQAGFLTKAGNSIQNEDLVSKFIQFLDQYKIDFEKVKAHQKSGETENFNRVVDKHCRRIVRQAVKEVETR